MEDSYDTQDAFLCLIDRRIRSYVCSNANGKKLDDIVDNVVVPLMKEQDIPGMAAAVIYQGR
ncbi:hypothetical protein LOS88_05335 [Aeromonas veronii]|uniref:hypothetical protein n=1 Tax=Aeromonas veronii TaxID=654 RepID=UPI001FD63E28|nr:hypothetical protein [Aeromonas veronii]UOR20090.1 hypothetical protein LOS88_05335 [Aeromonas veronii]